MSNKAVPYFDTENVWHKLDTCFSMPFYIKWFRIAVHEAMFYRDGDLQ